MFGSPQGRHFLSRVSLQEDPSEDLSLETPRLHYGQTRCNLRYFQAARTDSRSASVGTHISGLEDKGGANREEHFGRAVEWTAQATMGDGEAKSSVDSKQQDRETVDLSPRGPRPHGLAVGLKLTLSLIQACTPIRFHQNLLTMCKCANEPERHIGVNRGALARRTCSHGAAGGIAR